MVAKRVHYCVLVDHPDHELASRQQRRYGGVLAFEVAGGREAAWQFIDATVLMSLTANLGDDHRSPRYDYPWSVAHGEEAGINRMIRIAVGLEDVEDLQADCEFAAAHRAWATLTTDHYRQKAEILIRRPHR